MDIIKFTDNDEKYGCFSPAYHYETIAQTPRGRVLISSIRDAIEFSKSQFLENYQLSAADTARGFSLEEAKEFAWESVCIEYIDTILRDIYDNDLELCNKLLATGDSYLIYLSETDSLLGTSEDYTGSNLFGILLMQLREQLKFAL